MMTGLSEFTEDDLCALILEAIKSLQPNGCFVETDLTQKQPQLLEVLDDAENGVRLGVAQVALTALSQRLVDHY